MGSTTILTYNCACGNRGMVSKRNSLLSGGRLQVPHCVGCGRVICSNCSKLETCNECYSLLSGPLQSKVQTTVKRLNSSLWCIIGLVLGQIASTYYWMTEEGAYSFIAAIMGIGIGFFISIPLMWIHEGSAKAMKKRVLNDVKQELASVSQSGGSFQANIGNGFSINVNSGTNPQSNQEQKDDDPMSNDTFGGHLWGK